MRNRITLRVILALLALVLHAAGAQPPAPPIPVGQYIGRLPLTAGSAGLTADVIQPEGITRTPHGRLHIVCEPNLLYIFAKP